MKTKLYSGGEPQFTEGDIFRTIIPLSEIATMTIGPRDEVEGKKTDVLDENPSIGLENLSIGRENPSFDEIRVTEKDIEIRLEKCKYIQRAKESLLRICVYFAHNKIFGAPEIERLLGCSGTTAKELMSKLREQQLVVAVKGKGKYCLKTKEELQ